MSSPTVIVEVVAATPDAEANRHFRSQHTFLTDARSQLLPDFIGRFERIDTDFRTLASRLGGATIELPHLLRSTRGHHRDYYDARTRRLAAERYGVDVERFGYEF